MVVGMDEEFPSPEEGCAKGGCQHTPEDPDGAPQRGIGSVPSLINGKKHNHEEQHTNVLSSPEYDTGSADIDPAHAEALLRRCHARMPSDIQKRC